MAFITLISFVGLRRSAGFDSHSTATITKHVIPSKNCIKASKFSTRVVGRNLRVTVVSSGLAGGSAVEKLSKEGVETILFERKLDNCKPCGGAIPLVELRG